jgi:hypothetical protein
MPYACPSCCYFSSRDIGRGELNIKVINGDLNFYFIYRNNGKGKVLLGIGGGHYAPRHMDIAS